MEAISPYRVAFIWSATIQFSLNSALPFQMVEYDLELASENVNINLPKLLPTKWHLMGLVLVALY